MTYRSLLVLLDNDARCAERTRVSIGLARALDAHLVGLAATGRIPWPVSVDGAAMLDQFAGMAWAALHGQAQQAARQFADACGDARLHSAETVVVEEDKAVALVRHAHCSDLVVVGQPDPDRADCLLQRDTVESVVLHSARPTLIVPYAGQFGTIGQRVMVAWDDSREAARAVADALPLLRRAEQVQVVAWQEGSLEGSAPLAERLGTLRQWLAWHGVAAETSVETSGIAIAEAMLSRAADLDADMLVMGAYGHMRWTERMLGGATRGLLDAMTVPVLMAH
ncbi:universal stress protein [Aquincola sp. S2]|uniref:Universal stress protein n=1 Tax=Pseudaquabacterium terrae TaxID=2732868 RepID=A0ABX2ER42_9BURK|nr:universal stress protein [Aquabacterium terrae]NRF71127.1 universal stress protein [Aquabacterium terrae]